MAVDSHHAGLVAATIFPMIKSPLAAMMTLIAVAVAFAVMTAGMPVVTVIIIIGIAIIIAATSRLIIAVAAITALDAYANDAMTAVMMSVAR